VTRPRIAVLDYEAGNLHSAVKALQRAGADAVVTASAADAADAAGLVVPGVGHFGQCARQFRAAGFEALAHDWVRTGRPLLGICVGMQILYPASDESPGAAGLGILPGHVRRLPAYLTVPHMGWNTIAARRDDPLLAGVAGEQCYFVHSYYAAPADDAHVVAAVAYGVAVPAIVRQGRVVGVQFHPEKSAAVGARLLENWLAEVAGLAAPPTYARGR
jgi:imidazole glycerol-phosphate synthase subunit HisH